MCKEPYELAIGADSGHWFVAVRPPVPDEVMASRIGGPVMQGWAVEETESDTVFRKHTNASHEATLEAAQHLMDNIAVTTRASILVPNWEPVDMRGLSSPFEQRRES